MKKLLTTLLLPLALAGFAVPAAQAQDAKAGEKKNAMCIGCHGITGYQASFPEIHKVPMIAGQGAKYIASALTAYQKGERKHPTMRAIAASLSEQDIADLAAFYELQGKGSAAAAPAAAVEPPSAAVAALLAKGNCASCHGASFGAPIDPTYPKLAGQHADYLYAALKSYQVQNSAQIGRNNAIMTGMAAPFSRKELKLLANYLGSLPGDLKTVPEAKFR
jgi:cytochrome c553